MSSSDLPFTDSAQQALQAAVTLAKDNANGAVVPLHLASALLNPSTSTTQTGQTTLFHNILNKAGADPSIVQRAIAKLIVRLPAQDPPPEDVSISPNLAKILTQSKRLMSEKVSFLPRFKSRRERN